MCRVSRIFVSLLAVFGLTFITPATSMAAQDTLVLKLAHTSAPHTPIFETYELFKKKVEEKSGGKIIVQVYPLGQLGGDVPTAEGVLKGSIDIASAGSNNMAPFTDIFFWADLPFIFKSIDTVHKVYAGEIGNEYKEKLEKSSDFKCLFYADPGSFRNLMSSKRPLRSPADMGGLKFRSAPSPVEMDTVRAIGASPTPVSWPETYMALEQKVVDGEMQQYHWAVTAMHQEVIKYVTEVPGQHALHLALINKNKFEALPTAWQKILQEAADEAQQFNFANAEKMNESLKKTCLDAGVTIYTATPEEVNVWREAAMPVWKKYQDKVPQALVERILAAQK
ncbi:TRAP transporter substrate-binding protein [Desulfovibrio cuneatus]|uniref:TRAP transporter substrate-binding protein n=1 Tax=Desulfovibrio cuneatus TaxID=159728 RepID=UPI00054F1589|nr:TRAP transporter substrate-binding protein [Desulfovibrio cuneatus]